MVQLILWQNVDPSIVASDGVTALDVAVHYKNKAAIQLLRPLAEK
jgi:ankyrin repeat protein